MKDILTIATCMNDYIRIYAVNSTNTIKRMQEIHKTYPTSGAALGRVLTLGLMMSVMEKKKDERLTIKIEGDGPIGNIVCEAKYKAVRGFVHNPGVYLKRNDGKLAVGLGVGGGFMTVIKDYGLKEPYTSTIPLVTGEIAEDACYYFLQSEQTNTAVSLGVLYNKEANIESAGGYIVQLMPGCPDEYITKLEETLKTISPISTLLSDGKSNLDIIKLICDDAKVLEEMEVSYFCECERNKFLNNLKVLGKDEINKMILENKDIEITCNFCNKVYIYKPEELKTLL